MKQTPFLILTLLAPLHSLAPLGAQDPAEEVQPPDPEVTLERGAYAEEYERDLERAEALYALAVEVAQAQGDETTARAAAAALARVQARRAGAPAAAASQQDQAIVERIGELLQGLSRIPLGIDDENPQWANYAALTTDLAVYGDAVVPWLEALLAPNSIDIGPFRVQLDTRMAARRLAQLNTDAANAALARALQARDPLIRRAVAEELSWHRHRSLLELAARDSVPQVRSVAVRSLVRMQDPALLPVIEPEAVLGDKDAVRWLLTVVPERGIVLLQEASASPMFIAHATDELYRTKLPATAEMADVLLGLARELDDEAQREKVLSAMKRFFGNRGQWQEAQRPLRDHVQQRLLSEPDRYPRQAAFELLAEVGDFATFEYLSRELTRWPEGRSDHDTQWLRNATRSLVKKLEAGDFDRLATLLRELPMDPASPADTVPSWHGGAVTQLSELADAGEVSAESVVRGYTGLEGLLRTTYFWIVENWMNRFGKEPVDPSEFAPLLPILRDMLDGGRKGTGAQRAAMLGLAALHDLESLPRIIALTASDSEARSAVARFYRTDAQRTTDDVVAAILGGRIGSDAINLLEEPHDLEAFRRIWPQLEDEPRRGAALYTLVNNLWGADVDAAIVEMYPHMKHPATRVRAIARFGNHLYEPAIPMLGRALEDPDQDVRGVARTAFLKFKEHREALEEFAAWTLGDRQARQQIDELIALLASSERDVVIGAIQALGAVRARAALPELVRLLERDDEAIRTAVHAAIERIGS